MVSRLSHDFPPPFPPLPKYEAFYLPKPNLSASYIGTPLAKPTEAERVSLLRPKHAAAKKAAKSPNSVSCSEQISLCVSGCARAFCMCIRRIFCCFQKKKVDYEALAKREVNNFKGQKRKANQFAILKKIANMYKEHKEIKTQYEEATKMLHHDDFKQWLTINSSRTFQQVKQDPISLGRAADYARACAEKEEIAKKDKTPQGLLKILNLKIDHAKDKKAFQKQSFSTYQTQMLPIKEWALSLDDFIKQYGK